MNSAVKGCIAFWAVAGVVMIVALVVTSYKKLQSDEVGIQYNKLQKSLGDEVFTEGLHPGPVGYEFIIFPNVFTTLEYDDLVCLNKDGVDTQIDVAFQFKVVLRRMKDVLLDFKDFEGYKQVLKYSGSSVIHEACSLYTTQQFQAERGQFQTALSANLTQRFLQLHADIKDLQVNNIKRPREYEDAIRSKERAREDIEVARNERPRLLTEAETKRREAESDAQIIMDKAASDARVLETKAHAEAEAIQTQFAREAEAYEQVVRPGASGGLGFKAEGFISYLSTRVLAAAKNPVYIGLHSPARTEYFTPRMSSPIEPPH